MQRLARRTRRAGKRIGFVPTMGYLHDGHLSLIRLAAKRADWVVVSLFVNPTQFGPGEDLDRYPRDFTRDKALCAETGVDVLFCPTAAEMYPPGYSVYVAETRLSGRLCGVSRPHHFGGVTTVVAKLFNLVAPDFAVFGQKDAQQARIVRQMVRDLNFPVKIRIAPIVREPDGLAMSSRNRYLSPGERADALCLHRALQEAERLHRDGERDASVLSARMRALIAGVASAEIDYIEIVDDETLQPVETITGRTLVALAVRIGKTRLIDNVVL